MANRRKKNATHYIQYIHTRPLYHSLSYSRYVILPWATISWTLKRVHIYDISKWFHQYLIRVCLEANSTSPIPGRCACKCLCLDREENLELFRWNLVFSDPAPPSDRGRSRAMCSAIVQIYVDQGEDIDAGLLFQYHYHVLWEFSHVGEYHQPSCKLIGQ